MLRLLNYSKDFIPAKRIYERKPESKLVYEYNGTIHLLTFNNN